MKTLFTLTLVLFSITNIFSQTTEIQVHSELGEKFFLTVDGVEQNKTATNMVTVRGIEGRKAYIQVKFEDKRKRPVNKEVKFVPRGNFYTYQLILKKKKKTRDYKLKKAKSEPMVFGPPCYELKVEKNYEDTVLPPGTFNPYNVDRNLLPNYDGRIKCSAPMTSKVFSVANSKIPDDPDGDLQLNIAKEQFGGECLLVSQIISAMSRFTYDYTKMQFAKFAYHRVYDINNFKKVILTLENTNYQQELENYIQQNPR